MKKFSNYWAGVACGLVAAVIWAAFPVMTRFGVSRSNLDAWDMTFIRFIFSGLLAIPYFFYSINKQKYRKIPFAGILIMVLGLGAPYMLVIALGLKFAPVEQFAVVTPASMIAFSLLLSVVLLKNKILNNEFVGISIIMLGVVFVGFFVFKSSSAFSYLLFLLGGFMWAMYTVASRYFCDSALYATALVSFFSMIFYSPIYFYLKGFSIFIEPVGVILPQIIYQGFFVSIVALYFYSKSVFLLGSTAGSVFAALVPALATIISAILLKELPHLSSIIGLVIITIGMMITVIKWKTSSNNQN